MSTTEGGYEVVGSGFGLAEGPVVDGSGALYVADTLLGGVRCFDSGGAEEVIAPGRRGIGGLAVHEDGSILASGRDIAVVDPQGARPVLVDSTVTGFNDLGVGPGGELLAGALRYRPFRGEAPIPGVVRIIDTDGTQRGFRGEIFWPNGIAVSEAGWAYVADFATGTVFRASWSEAHEPELHRWWSSPSGQADGLAVDQAGCVLIALGNGEAIARVLPDGTTDQVLEVPGGRFVSSLCFAGEDLRDLIVTTAGSPEAPPDHPDGRVLRLAAGVPGLPVPLARIPVAAPSIVTGE
jgi:D-xylonolactonase